MKTVRKSAKAAKTTASKSATTKPAKGSRMTTMRVTLKMSEELHAKLEAAAKIIGSKDEVVKRCVLRALEPVTIIEADSQLNPVRLFSVGELLYVERKPADGSKQVTLEEAFGVFIEIMEVGFHPFDGWDFLDRVQAALREAA